MARELVVGVVMRGGRSREEWKEDVKEKKNGERERERIEGAGYLHWCVEDEVLATWR